MSPPSRYFSAVFRQLCCLPALGQTTHAQHCRMFCDFFTELCHASNKSSDFQKPKWKLPDFAEFQGPRPFKASKPNFPALASGWAGSAMCILSHAIRLQLANMCKLVPHSISRHVCPYLISTLPKERSNKTRFQFASPRTAHNCRCSRMFKPQSR